MSDEKTIALGEDESEVEVTIEDTGEKATEEAKASEKEPEAPKVSKPEGGPDDDDDELGQYSENVKKRINKLTFKARERERERDAALELARALKEENDRAKQSQVRTDLRYATEYENRLKADQKLLNAQLRAAIDAGDADAQIELNQNLVAIQTELARVGSAKSNIQSYARQHNIDLEKEAPAPKREPEKQTQPTQPQVKPDAKAEAWAEKNEWFGQDKAMTQAAFAFHQDLIDEGVDPSSDDYYGELDTRMRAAFPRRFKNEPAREERKPVTQAVATARPQAAAPSRNSIKLTPSQVAICKKLGVSYEDYARHLQALKK